MAVKKTTKKTAKKTVPKLKKKVTIDELTAIMADLAKGHAKTEAAIRNLSAENAKTEISIRELSAANQKSREETDNALRELSRTLGHVGKDIGELTEFIVIPKIRLAMNAIGKHTFDSIQTDRIFKKIDNLGEKKTLTEVDALLYGNTEVMAVETKTHPAIRDIKHHIERLEILRQHEDLVGISGKKLFGAVVGAIIDKEVKDFALERGLYVVKIREEEEKLDIAEPETRRTW